MGIDFIGFIILIWNESILNEVALEKPVHVMCDAGKGV